MQRWTLAKNERFDVAPAYIRYFSTPHYDRLSDPLAELGINLDACVDRSTVIRRTLPAGDPTPLDVHVKVYSYSEYPWRRFLRPLKIEIEMLGLREFEAAGMRVPSVVGWGWKRGPLGRPEQECLMTETERDTVAGEHYFPRASPKPALDEFRIHCIRRLARELRSLHARNYYHRDFAFRNVLIRPQADGGAETIWFDSPRGIRTRLPIFSDRCRLRDLVLIRFLSESGKDEFLSSYLGLPTDHPEVGRWKGRIAAYAANR